MQRRRLRMANMHRLRICSSCFSFIFHSTNGGVERRCGISSSLVAVVFFLSLQLSVYRFRVRARASACVCVRVQECAHAALVDSHCC